MIDATNNNSSINHINTPRTYTMNQAYLAYANAPKVTIEPDSFTSNNKTIYYNDEKKAKKKKTKTKAIFAATALAGVAIAATFISGKAGNKNMQKTIQAISESRQAEKAKGFFEKIGNGLANANNVKDDALERVATCFKDKNIPILKYLDNYCSGTKKFYRSILNKSPLRSAYTSAAEILRKKGVEVEDFDKWFEKLDKCTTDALKGTDRHSNFTKGLLDKDIFKKMSDSNIADGFLSKNDDFLKITKNIAAEGLDEDGIKALEELNKTRGKIAAKMRDINAGSAATDFITDGVALATLGIGIKSAEDKEEKKSIALNLGLPLISTLGCAFIGNLMAIAGAPCMIFGFAVGQVAKMAAKFITKPKQNDSEQKQV